MNFLRKRVLAAVTLWMPLCAAPASQAAGTKPTASAVSDAVCPIVYPLDQSASERGYHYIFYGNAFFINDDGYLLTAAHVLSQLYGAQPYILLRRPNAPPRLLPTAIIASDAVHDVALLRATPNPFAEKYQVRFLRLLVESPSPSVGVMASALRPSRLKDPHSFDAFVEDRPSGKVLGYEFTSEHGHQDTQLFLFSHEVLFGDSGAPVVADNSQAVVGLVEGRWLRPAGSTPGGSLKQSTGIGAAIPIHYALPLLLQHGIAWRSFPQSSDGPAPGESVPLDVATPKPLSLVPPPYPSQALLSGDVVLDAVVDQRGQLADIRVLGGDPPFSEKAVWAARTWTFVPARSRGEPLESRIGIFMQFRASVGATHVQSAISSSDSAQASSQDVLERGPIPAAIEPIAFRALAGSEASAILTAQVDAEGHPSAMQLLRGDEMLAPSLTAALGQWRFLPARHAGANTPSSFIAVEIVRAAAPAAQSSPLLAH